MKTPCLPAVLGSVVSTAVLFLNYPTNAQFISVTADIEFTDWDAASARPHHCTVQCVVGTNSWQMGGDFSVNSQTTYWFTGTNLIEHSVVTRLLQDERLERSGILAAPIGAEVNHVSKSIDGNPGTLSACGPDGRKRNVGPDHLDPSGRVAWLAFCSGPCLKRDGRQIFPPSDLWKELVCAPSGFSDHTKVFEDGLGLPQSVNLYTPKSEPVLQYRVLSSTNVAGWHVPLEFYLAQYRPAYLPNSNRFGTNGWELQLTARGKVTSIGLGATPPKPPEVLEMR